ncbi:ankycorbin, putative [Entamoeba invadens IP1]|uniref:Ankycorbin, putative n=1 Tax=Entamoeba invadens IP1 TaxID=370355 RepID=L7FNS8_ENTIV|nr:ankycorbin, putative [Entamoeba invadens IP1]ELP94556.1 ankycorbin, putative [Entamoeba invadens IP1]|eukprot:XP_004261327.1 ankycorbin, putative [Entamoeba invadens IP1]
MILPIPKNDLKKTQLALDDTEKKLDQQVTQNKKASDERDGCNQQLQAEKTKTAALTTAKNAKDKNRKLDSSKKDAQRKIAELTKRIEDGLNDSDMLKAQKADYEAQIQALKDDTEKTEKDLAGARKRFGRFRRRSADNEKRTKAKSVVDAKLKDAEREKAALNEEVEAANEKLRITKNDLGRTKAEFDQLQQNFDYLKKNADTDAADKEKLNGTVNESNKKIEELSAKVDEFSGVITRKEQEFAGANEELETVKKDKFAKEIEAKKLKAENDEIKEKVKNLAYDKDQLSSEKKKLQDEYDQLINLVNGHEDETNNLNGSIKKLQRDLEINKTELTELRDRTANDNEKIVGYEKWSVEDASKIENYESHIKALEAQKKMALDDKTEAEKTAADQSDKRKKMEDQVKHSMHKFQEKNMLNARIAEIQTQPDEERQKADSADAVRKADLQKELEKDRAMKQKPDKKTQKLRVKVTDSEAKLADAGATGASIAKLKAKYETEFEGIETEKKEAQNAAVKAKKQAKQYTRKVEEAERKLAKFEQKESTINTQISKIQAV